MFNLNNSIFQRLIWMIRVYFLWFDYWFLKEWKTAKVQNYSVAAYELFTQMIGPLFDMFTVAVYFFFSGKFQNIYQPRTTLDLLSFDSLTHINGHFMQKAMLNKPARDGECRLTPFHAIRNFLANENYHFSRLSHQTGCPFTWAACSI